MDRHKLFWLLFVTLSCPRSTNGDCILTELPKEDDVCNAIYDCDQVITEVGAWECLKQTRQVYPDYDYYHRRPRLEVIYDTNYRLQVNLRNVNNEYDIFENAKLENILQFHITDGDITVMPESVYKLTRATEIIISNVQISTVNLDNFVELRQLTKISLRNNTIATLDTEKETSMPSSSITVVDLSQNVLETIPDNSFSLYTHVQHLNLSYNMIRHFGILTFEGVIQLETLDVSHNLLFEIGNTFTRFMKLKELCLENNNLSKIYDYNLNTLIKLEKLNLSSNAIENLESNSFKTLYFLEILDLSNNKIEVISKELLEKNSNLQSVFVSNNRIKHIESGAFKGKNITRLNLLHNNISGNIEQETFSGIHVSELDLSNGSITSLENETFISMCSDLVLLNVSSNSLKTISHSAFTCLNSLSVLDLSHNQLKELYFEKNSLLNLTKLYVQDNSIVKLTKYAFKSLDSLVYLDLSFNALTEVEPMAFDGLGKIEMLSVSHSLFVNTLHKDIFDGMKTLQAVDLSFTRTSVYENESFSGLIALERINSSYGQLSNLEYNVFIKTGSLVELDLSHNLLETFNINTSSIPGIEILYLNDNKIRHISNKTFFGLKLLRMLYLNNNNIKEIEPNALRSLEKLGHLYLSRNTEMIITGNSFDNLTNLYQVKLDNIKTRFSFQNTSGIKIKNLDMNSCGIVDLNKLFVFKVSDIYDLNLSANKIMTIDKFSFQLMPNLVVLDLSSNIISYIQPGSFLHASMLKTLSLYDNNLQTLEFGVFDGIKALTLVNLSNNALQSFDTKLLPAVLKLDLDNNDIKYLNFDAIFKSNIHLLSIGGNKISCNILAELKNSKYAENFKQVIQTTKVDFHSENVDGISCQSLSKNDAIIIPTYNNTGYDIRKMLIAFTNAIEKLSSSIDVIGNYTKKGDQDFQQKSDINILNSITKLVDISNQTQLQTNKYFENMINTTKTYQEQIDDIKEYLINLTSKTDDTNVNSQMGLGIINEKYLIEKINKMNAKNDDIRSEMRQMLKEEIDEIREEFGKTLRNTHNPNPLSLHAITKEGNSDTILYFIAGSLGLIVILYIVNAVYGYVKRNSRRTNNHSLHGSSRPIASDIEME